MKRSFVINTVLLTCASLLMRCIGMAFQVWLAGRIGAAGIGLYQLVMSVELLCATFAISGIRFASTRLVAEEIGLGREGGVDAAMRRCIAYSLFFGLAAFVVLWLTAEPIGFLWIGDARTVRSLRTLSVGLPFISLCSVFSGYFTACGRVWKPSLVHLIEQLASITLVAAFLSRSAAGDIEAACCAVTRGVTCADALSFLMMLAFYKSDRRAHTAAGESSPRMTSRVLFTALPLAFSAYARSALSTLEQLLIPRGLKKAGFTSDRALSGYGVITGMVMPIIAFPSSLLLSLAELIVPELTEAQMRKDDAGVSRAVSSLVGKTLVFSSLAGALMFALADKLGIAIYSSSEAGRYIRLLAPLVPVMYTDMIVDGCLKGLGQQVWSMGINVLDSALGVLLVWTLLPRWALGAYIFIIYFDECLNFALSSARLRRVISPRRAPAREAPESRGAPAR